MKTKTLIPLIAILALAALLRFWNLDATEFKYDEATVCNLAAHFVDTGLPPARGMGSSVGIDNPPMTIYVMSLPVLLSRDPWVASAFVALLNVIGVGACYWLVQRYWDQKTGLLAALLLAASPWAVFYSRKVWAQNLLLPFVILFFALLLAWVVERRRWALCWAIVTLSALTQIHFATLAFAPLLGLLLLIEFVRAIRHKQSAFAWKPLLLGTGIGFLIYAPYLVLDAAIGWKNVRALIAMLRAPGTWQWKAARFALLNIGGREIHALAGAQKFELFLDSILNLSYWPDRIEEGLVVLSLIYLVIRWWRARGKAKPFARDSVLLLWLISPVIFYLRSKSDVFPHYLIPLYPAPYLALAAAIVDLTRLPLFARPSRWKTALYGIGSLCLVALVAWQSYLSIQIYAFVETHHTPGGMGTPIGTYRRIAQTIQRYTTEWDNNQVIVLCSGDEYRWQECPAVFHFITSRMADARLVDYNQALLFPRSNADTLILLTPGESIAADVLPEHAELLANETIWLREKVGAYRFYRLPAGYTPSPSVQPAPARFENGVLLLGYDPPASGWPPGQAAPLALYWRVEALSAHLPPQGYSFTTNLLGPDGQRFGQQDGPGYRADMWRTGDTIISWFPIPLPDPIPPKPHTLRVGMYIFEPPDKFETIHVIGPDGQPGQAVDWPLP